jgi:hypothetical protein
MLDKSAHRMAVGKLTGGEQQQRRRGGRRRCRAILRHDGGRLRQTNQITFTASNVTPVAQTRLVLFLCF